MKHFAFHLMPYKDLPEDFAEQHDSAWVWVPNDLYETEVAAPYYQEYIDQLVHAEELGFDGVCINEHHQNVYGLMPSPNLIAAALTQVTKRVKIAIVGNALPLYDPPTRVAEEMAMLDCMSGGRIIAGMVIGGGPEYYSFSMNPAEARTRFAEAHDIILGAWTKPGPWEFYGEHYKLRYVNTIPRPVQKPHPPIWIPGVGSLETMDFVAKRRYAYMGIPYFDMRVFKKTYSLFRDACGREGYEPHPEQMGLLMPIYVAETDELARREFEEHFWYFKNNLIPGLSLSPPGYTSVKSALRVFRTIETDFIEGAVHTWDDVERGCYALCGSPDTVAEKLIEHNSELGAGNFLGLFQLGNMPDEKARASMQAFAEAVKPRLDEAFPTPAEGPPTRIPFPDEALAGV